MANLNVFFFLLINNEFRTLINVFDSCPVLIGSIFYWTVRDVKYIDSYYKEGLPADRLKDDIDHIFFFFYNKIPEYIENDQNWLKIFYKKKNLHLL